MNEDPFNVALTAVILLLAFVGLFALLLAAWILTCSILSDRARRREQAGK